MSSVIQIFDRIVANDVRSALAACNREVQISPRVTAMFDQFLREVQHYYPVAAKAGAGGSALIWTEGLPFGSVDSSPLNLGVDVNLLDDTVLSTLGHVAADAGLQMFEPQGGALYRLDRKVVYDDGRIEPFADRAPKIAPQAAPASKFDPTSTPHTLDVICNAMCEQLGGLGFEVKPHPVSEHVRLVQRHYGPTLQAFSFQVQPEHDRQYVHFTLKWWLPEVRESWQRRLDLLGGPELRKRIYPPFIAEHETALTAFGDRRDPRVNDYTLRTEEDLQAHAQALAAWCAGQGMVYQNLPKDLAATGRWLLSAKHLSSLILGGEGGSGLLHLNMQMAQLVLAMTCKTPLRDVWIEALRFRQRATQARHWQPVTGDDGNDIFDRLVASLREEPPVLNG